MAIRIRKVGDTTIALCAAKSRSMPGDLYLGDAAHHALSTKFVLDWYSEGILKDTHLADEELVRLMKKHESERH